MLYRRKEEAPLPSERILMEPQRRRRIHTEKRKDCSRRGKPIKIYHGDEKKKDALPHGQMTALTRPIRKPTHQKDGYSLGIATKW